MSLVKLLILCTGCSEKVEVYRKVITEGKRGSDKTEIKLITNATVSIQSTGTRNKVEGLTLQDSKAGVTIKSVWVMYSEFIDLKEHDLIKRKDGLLYEVKNLEPNGMGSTLAHMKSYLVKADNQDEL